MTPSSPAPIKYPDRLFIDGQWVMPTGDAKFEVLNCGTEEVFARIACAEEADVRRAVAAARKAFDEGPWPRMSHRERAQYLEAIAVELDARAEDMARIWTTETGVIKKTSDKVALGMAVAFRFYAGLGETFPFTEEHKPRDGGNVGLLVREPVGVVGAIIAWNGALTFVTYKVAPALIAGCTVVVKASPEAPCAAYVMAEICAKIGLPPGVFNVVTADREVSEVLVRHPGVDKISFTGSTAAGRRIASICADRVARCTLELGGKSAAIILDDYDIELAAKKIGGGSTHLTGQACSALTRIVINRDRHDAFVEALGSVCSASRIGDPFEPSTQMGPLASSRQRERVEHFVALGKTGGATLVSGGGRPPHLDRGFFFEPTVFGNVDNRSTIAQEEIFGPVLCVIPVTDEEDAIRIANHSIYGLNNAIYTNDADRAYAVARRLRSGTVGHNACRSDFSIAFGGFKQSGLGREGGREGLLPFLETKTIILDRKPVIDVTGSSD